MLERHADPSRTTPQGLMGALVQCACGHGIGAHAFTGCRACPCGLTDGEALNASIARAAEPPKPRRAAAVLAA